MALAEVISHLAGQVEGHIPRPAVGTLVIVKSTIGVDQQERFTFKLWFVEVFDSLALLGVYASPFFTILKQTLSLHV